MSGYRIIEKPYGAIGGQTVFNIMSPGGLVAASVIGKERQSIAVALLQMIETDEQHRKEGKA